MPPSQPLGETQAVRGHIVEQPHCAQAQPLRYATSRSFTRKLDGMPRMPYQPRNYEKTVIHWGQRKLLLSEIEFLMKFVNPAKRYLCVYAGGGPGTHTNLLADMFPNVYFWLIDPVKFTCKPVRGHIRISEGMFFTNETCREVRKLLRPGQELLFISDIRSQPESYSQLPSDEYVEEDMKKQLKWYQILDATCPLIGSMFKFRLPYKPGNTRYLEGEMYLPVWGPQSTTETRLIVGPRAGFRNYNHTVHEEQMFYFNNVFRPSVFPPLVGVRNDEEGVDNCYDCTAEAIILLDYVEYNPQQCCEVFNTLQVCEIMEIISRRCDRHRRLKDPNPDREQRRRNMYRRSRKH